ncbi:PTS glucose transporter subunit IIA [Spiroplasma endosymbiont of Amphibalanus improvisus]|uniref:PTS sugar transporter subunit IIA n=1 Tax=Spiroplasma endosymbiont of Amphibalanus improvisus TaxID=3066327 RepID=UPI00313C4F6B
MAKDIVIYAPVSGTIKDLSKIKDDVFSEKMLGDGIAIVPDSNKFFAPMDGKLLTVFPSGHAYGIQHKKGIEMLIHIGLDTVNLNGEGFDVKVKQGDKVKTGNILVEIDLEAVSKKVPSMDTPIVFTPSTLEGREIEVVAKGKVEVGDKIAIIKKTK